MQEAACFVEQLTLFAKCECLRGGDNQDSLFGRTSPEPFRATRELTFETCSRKSDRPRFQCLQMADGRTQEWRNCLSVKSHGASSTLNIGECPNVAVESFLLQILQPITDVPEKYYLSMKACLGILRRARERGKELPEELKAALERQAGNTPERQDFTQEVLPEL